MCDTISHTGSAITVHIYTLDGQSVTARGGHLLRSKDRFVIVVSIKIEEVRCVGCFGRVGQKTILKLFF